MDRVGQPFVGTSGWIYGHWRGTFYPEDLPTTKWLPYYFARFKTVEINGSFYRAPTRQATAGWRANTPDDFRFVIKAWRLITHRLKLKNAKSAVDDFFDRLEPLGDKLACVLFQMPPRFKKNLDRIDEFVAHLPKGIRYAFEFRDPTWHDEDVFRKLADHGAAFCCYDLAHYETPRVRTADFAYVRLHGPSEHPYRGSYSPAQLRSWAKTLRGWRDEGADVFCYFDNDDSGFAAKDALRLQKALARP